MTALEFLRLTGEYAAAACDLLGVCLTLYFVEAAPALLGRAEPVKA